MHKVLKILILILFSPLVLKAQVASQFHYSYAPENEDLILEKTFIESVINGQKEPNSLNAKGYTALQLSINRGYTQSFKALIELSGIDLNLPNKYGIRPVHMTVFSNQLEMLKAFHQKGADMMAADRNGYNLLHFSTLKSRPGFAHYLMSHFPHLSMATNIKGIIPLMLAIQRKDKGMVEVLSKFKGVVNWQLKNGFNSFLVAVFYESLEYIDEKDRNIGISELLFPYVADINEVNKNGDTAAHLAARGKHLPLINFLFKHGANFGIKNNQGLDAFRELVINAKKDLKFKKEAEPIIKGINREKRSSFLKKWNPFDRFRRMRSQIKL